MYSYLKTVDFGKLLRFMFTRYYCANSLQFRLQNAKYFFRGQNLVVAYQCMIAGVLSLDRCGAG